MSQGTMITSVVSELKDGARKAIGSYSFYLPTLSEFGIQADAKPVYEGEGEEKQIVGYEYEGNALNFLGKAVDAAVRAMARNKLLPKSATLRPGAKMPENFLEVITPGEGRGGSAVLAVVFCRRPGPQGHEHGHAAVAHCPRACPECTAFS